MSSLLRHVALVPDDNIGSQLSSSDVTRVAAALQKQVARDFGPQWDVKATVDAFATLDDVPLGYWPILVGRGRAGRRRCAPGRQQPTLRARRSHVGLDRDREPRVPGDARRPVRQSPGRRGFARSQASRAGWSSSSKYATLAKRPASDTR